MNTLDRSGRVDARMTLADAEQLHEAWLDLSELDGGILPECMRDDGRCFTFGIVTSIDTAERRFIEHAAEAAGFCWSCSKPDDGSNREACRRCWVMWWSREHRVMPRDIPEPWPGQ